MRWTIWVIVIAALLILWAQSPPDGQPFHQPGQSDRTVIWTP